MAVKDINDKGGVNGHPLEMLVLDTQAKPEIAINAANKLIDVDKVPLIITAWSSVVKAVAPVGNRTKTLELNMGANSPDIANLGDYVYSVFPLAEVDVTALAKYTRSKLGKKRAAVLYINNDTGIGGAKIYRDVFTAAGGEVVAFEGYDPKATDFTGVLLKARVGNPDVVHIHGLLGAAAGDRADAPARDAAADHQLFRRLQPEASVAARAGGRGADRDLAGADLGRQPERRQAAGAVEAVGRFPNGLPYLQYAWDSTIVVAQIYGWVDKNGLPMTGENCRKALLAIREFDLPMTGKLVIKDDHRIDKPVYLYVVKDNKFVLLDTVA